MFRSFSRIPASGAFAFLLVFAYLHLASCEDVQADPVLSVKGAVTDAVESAVESISQQLLNPTNTTNSTSEGRAALDEARAQAQVQAQRNASEETSILSNSEAAKDSSEVIGPPVVNCEGECEQLADELLDAVEGSTCRSLFTTGKCPSPCMQAISAITSNSSWPACASMCGGEMVTGAAQRWSTFCEIRQETLVDKGKEAVKNFVADGLGSGMHVSAIMRFSLGVMILFLGVAYGYRRGAISTHIAYRLQKRRLLARKNSDANLPI